MKDRNTNATDDVELFLAECAITIDSTWLHPLPDLRKPVLAEINW